MRVPALLLATALLLPAASVDGPAHGAAVPAVRLAATAPRLPEIPALDARAGTVHGSGTSALASAVDRVVLAGSEHTVAALSASGAATGRALPAPAQAPVTTTPSSTDQPASGGSTGPVLERWQAAIIAVVVAGAVVWLVGRLRRLGRKG